ncbi:SDR family NAD(P)-dependent oxidoreductase [Cumulibacter manganitolerans]|uniref:SDR family NAD(P)-dependent oxidoreductase n=1 Tax=Cumulibacter manganitolerans TaxID=1884992 RepID=UPI001297769C|nr:SDR family NAD(P)-dependent oxidoreductase [Cumulibacter manganitolerans]
MELDGRIAVVTGAGDGMGRELTLQLAAAGCQVAACDVSRSGLDQTVAALPADAPLVTTHLVDVADEQAMLGFAADVLEQHATDQVHLLFNNAGISGGGSLVASAREAWDRTFAVDFFGVVNGIRAFLPSLIAAPEAKIVNTASVNGFWATIGTHTPHTAYSAAKFAVKGLTEALITDLRMNAPHVTCAVVMPGHIGTGIVTNSRKVHSNRDDASLTPEELVAVRARLALDGRDAAGMSDDDVQTVVADAARGFEEKAPTTAREAATIILDGVRTDQWRILVGADAHELDRRVRRDPENAYTQEFYDSFVNEVGWQLGSS